MTTYKEAIREIDSWQQKAHTETSCPERNKEIMRVARDKMDNAFRVEEKGEQPIIEDRWRAELDKRMEGVVDFKDRQAVMRQCYKDYFLTITKVSDE